MSKSETNALPGPAFDDERHHLRIYQGYGLEILAAIPEATVDLVFADPPYFLSNGGITCHAGKMVSVNKVDWDKSRGPDLNHEFNRAWLSACQRVLKPNGTIWVSGTAHVIHSVGFAMQQKEEQRRSFAYDNTNIENPRITRETVDRAAEALKKSR